MKQTPPVLAALLLLLMAILSGGAALRESITVDEVAHIGAGVSYLQKLDLRLNQEHPPLAKVLAAVPLVLRGVRADYSDVSWTVSNAWFNAMLGEWAFGHYVVLRWNNRVTTLLWARAPMLALTLALGFCVYLFASSLSNSWGGVLCLAAFVSTPAFLTFGPLVLTDIAVTFFSLLTLWSFATMWQSPGRRTMMYLGLLFAGALLSKFSSGLLLFGFLAFRLSLRLLPLPKVPTDDAELRTWRRVRGRYLSKAILVASLTVYVVYFILSWNQPTDSMPFLMGHGPASLLLRRLLMPPWLYLRGLMLCALSSPRPTFILGQNYPRGVWFYFPILFLLKSTLSFLLMLALGVLVALVARCKLKDISVIRPETAFHWRALWTFLLVFVAGWMLSPMSISVRHFTVPIVLLILLLAPVPRALALLRENGWPAARLVAAGFVVLALTSLVTMIRAYPYFFPFLNSLSFGRPAYATVNDSNLDWDQSLPEVAQFVERRGIQHVLLDEYGMIEPTVYIPQAEFWNCQLPAPADAGQWAIVSADMIEDGHNCLWLMNFPHTSLAGGSMYAFKLPSVIPRVGDPNGPPPPEAQRNFGGLPGPDSRLLFLKCIRDPKQLQPTMDHMRAQYEAEMARRKAQRQKH